MDLPPDGHTPDQREGRLIAALRATFVACGILLRADIQLRQTPKPWPANVRKARLLVAQAEGILLDFNRSQHGTDEVIQALKGPTAPDPLGSADSTRTRPLHR